MAEKRVTKPPVAQNKCEAFGLDSVCDLLISGCSLTDIASRIGVHVSSLLTWCEADPQRSARVKEARRMAGRVWDEQAELCLMQAADPFELSKAKELAHHYRWRAKAVAPRDYGDKVTQEITGRDGGAVQVTAVDLRGLSDEELTQMQLLMSKAVSK